MAPTGKSLKCHKDLFEVQLPLTWHHLHNTLTTLISSTVSIHVTDMITNKEGHNYIL